MYIPNILPRGEVADATQRRCYDCSHLKGYVFWWCKNEEAVKWRGTAIPGVHDCPFWSPAPTEPPTLVERIKGWWRGRS